MDWGSGRGFVAARAASGGPARWGSPACGALTVAVAYRLQKLAQKGDKVGACLTEVRIERKRDAGRSAATSSGGSGAAHAEEAVAGVGVGEGEVDGAPDSKAKPRRRLAEVERRRNSESTAVRVLLRAEQSWRRR